MCDNTSNYIAFTALLISLISFGLSFLDFKDKRKSEASQLISDTFTKLLIIQIKLKALLPIHKLLLSELQTLQLDRKNEFSDNANKNMQSINNTLNTLESLEKELISIQNTKHTGSKLSMLQVLKLRILSLENHVTESESSTHELVTLTGSLKETENKIEKAKESITEAKNKAK